MCATIVSGESDLLLINQSASQGTYIQWISIFEHVLRHVLPSHSAICHATILKETPLHVAPGCHHYSSAFHLHQAGSVPLTFTLSNHATSRNPRLIQPTFELSFTYKQVLKSYSTAYDFRTLRSIPAGFGFQMPRSLEVEGLQS